ncbi:hypothetical protein DFJ74DRAFT_771381 [Hyaloraphidium curvatum]|nr:hypothetical protein DFJ74DRAFT_771381 [Hyaloraphidium curvatum]
MASPGPPPVFVTGGRGALARPIAAHLRARHGPHAASLFSRTPGDGLRPLAGLLAPGGPAPARAVLHLAWSALPSPAESCPRTAGAPDLALLALLLAALASCPSPPHLVFFSSAAVHGDAPGRPAGEPDAPAPRGAYARAKLAAEGVLLSACPRLGIRCCILRIANPYGFATDPARPQGLVPRAARAARGEGSPVLVRGDGAATRDYLHLSDLLSAVDLVLDKGLAGVYNVGSGEARTVGEVLRAVGEAVGRAVPFVGGPEAAWEVRDGRISCGKLVAEGWAPRVGFAEGIARAVREMEEGALPGQDDGDTTTPGAWDSWGSSDASSDDEGGAAAPAEDARKRAGAALGA